MEKKGYDWSSAVTAEAARATIGSPLYLCQTYFPLSHGNGCHTMLKSRKRRILWAKKIKFENLVDFQLVGPLNRPTWLTARSSNDMWEVAADIQTGEQYSSTGRINAQKHLATTVTSRKTLIVFLKMPTLIEAEAAIALTCFSNNIHHFYLAHFESNILRYNTGDGIQAFLLIKNTVTISLHCCIMLLLKIKI